MGWAVRLFGAMLLALAGAAPLVAASSKEPVAIDSAGWVTTDDYPKEALQANLQGSTIVRLRIDATGQVERCEVMESSGHALLDSTTCDLLTKRARFTPALDRKGEPIGTDYRQRIVWRLPRLDEMKVVTELVIDGADRAQSCLNERRFTETTFREPCNNGGTDIGIVPPTVQVLRSAGLAGEFKLRLIATFSRSWKGSDVQLRAEKGWSQIARLQGEISIDATGERIGCIVLQSDSPDSLALPVCTVPLPQSIPVVRDAEGNPIPSKIYIGIVMALENGAAKTLRSLTPEGTSARPIGLPETWVTSDDYPDEALMLELQGTVALQWTIDAKGRATACRIVESSGYSVLDTASCRLIEERARYLPARDGRGKARPSEDHRRIVWTVPLEDGI